MRILMFDNEFPPLGGGTGIVNYHFLVEWAKREDVTVDLITSSRSRAQHEVESFSERITLYKVPVNNLNIHHARNIELLRYTWRGTRKAFQLLAQHHYEVAFAFAGVPAGAMAWWLKFRRGLPYGLSLEGPDIPGFEARYARLYPFLKPLLRRVWRSAGFLTAISKAHQDLAHQFMPDLDIPIVPNGVDADDFQPASDTPCERPLTLICVGRLIERKGQHHLLQALARLEDLDLRLLLVGTGDAEADLRALTGSLGLTDRVEFRGFVGRDTMPQVYHEADLFVLPSQSEGMSIALLEAMASGLPIAVTPTGGTDELLRDNGALIPWADPDGLARVLRVLLTDRAALRRMGTRSREIVKEFSWPTITNHYLDLCRSIAR